MKLIFALFLVFSFPQGSVLLNCGGGVSGYKFVDVMELHGQEF